MAGITFLRPAVGGGMECDRTANPVRFDDPSRSRSVLTSIEGHEAAENLLNEISATTPSPDLLYERLRGVLLAGGPDRLRAFMRRIQKAVEGGAQ